MLTKTPYGNILHGHDFPEHLQTAYGRNIARLELVGGRCKVYLRDLPASLYDLEYMGYSVALQAYEKESKSIEKRL